jgi:hypothetical protein
MWTGSGLVPSEKVIPMRTTTLIPLCSALLVGGAVMPASAAPPTFERFTIDEHFYDDWVSGQCGFDVWAGLTGFATLRTFERQGTGPEYVWTINLTLTLSSGDATYTLKDVGADIARVQPDGTGLLTIVGQVPFAFKGALKINPTTGEVVHEPRRQTGDEVARVCAALAP